MAPQANHANTWPAAHPPAFPPPANVNVATPTSAWTSSAGGAFVHVASSATSAASALATTRCSSATLPGLPTAPLPHPDKPSKLSAALPACANTNIDVDMLEVELSVLPNKNFVTALVNGLRYGFHVGFSAPRINVHAPNRPSALEHPEIVTAAIAKEVERGHTAGPFANPPFPVLACSPLACVPKKPDSWWLILDLSAPAGHSVNDGIPAEHGAVQYAKFDQIIRMIAHLGRGALIAKVDLKHAFRQCPVHPDDWPLLCYEWNGHYYVDLRLPFGLRSSPALFNSLAEGLCDLLRAKGIRYLEHYLDDFTPNSVLCASYQALILETFHSVGVLYLPGKNAWPWNLPPCPGHYS